MQKFFLQFVLIAIIFTAINFPVCSAKNFTFVDAEDETGYYVDKDTVKIESSESIAATTAVVKANLNKMYVYNVRINHKNQTYQINSSKIMEYDSQNVIETNDNVRPFRPYAPKSEMAELVNFVLYGDDLIN